MRLFICTLLAISCVHAHPIIQDLQAYSPARGEFPVYNSLSQGYVRYIDTNGVERQIGYNYPEPLYGQRRLSYGSGDMANPLLKSGSGFSSSYSGQEPIDIAKAREEHFRAWCAQRYEALKSEMDLLRAEGKKPSPDMMAQLAPLETIMSSSSYAAIGETAEVKRAREEHLRIWNEARLKVLQTEAEHLRKHGREPTPAKLESPYSYQSLGVIEETPEQKKVREEHLRLYNEQLSLVQKLEAERGGVEKSDTIMVKGVEALAPSTYIEQTVGAAVMETPEVMRAKEEHLRLWNEAKLRAEKEGQLETTGQYDIQSQPLISSVKTVTQSGFKGYQQQGQQQLPIAVEDTPEVMRARAEHLKLVEEARLRAQAGGVSYKPISEQNLLKVAPGVQQPLQPGKIISSSQPIQLYQQPAAEIANFKTTIPSTDFAIRQESSNIYDSTETKRLNDEEAGRRTEQLKELERQREEEKMRKVFQSIETERLAAEQRLMEAERLRLKQEEERRRETERLAEVKRDGLPQLEQSFIAQPARQEQLLGQITKSTIDTTIPVGPAQVGYTQFTLTEQQKQNPFFMRLAGQSGVQSGVQSIGQSGAQSIGQSGAYFASINGERTEALSDPSKYYLPAGSNAQVINLDSPLIVRYNQEGRPEFFIKPTGAGAAQGADAIAATKLKPIALEQLPSYFGGSSATMKINYGEGGGLSELEKATREHFRAHEIALEQLRLANVQNPYHKDC